MATMEAAFNPSVASPASPDAKLADVEYELIRLEAEIIKVQNRLPHVLYNFFVKRFEYREGDPRRKACFYAVIYKLFSKSAATAAVGSAGITALVALYFAYQANGIAEAERATITSDSLFAHVIQWQQVVCQNPELYPHFYGTAGEPLPKLDDKNRWRMNMLCEMFADTSTKPLPAGLILTRKRHGWTTPGSSIPGVRPSPRSSVSIRAITAI